MAGEDAADRTRGEFVTEKQAGEEREQGERRRQRMRTADFVVILLVLGAVGYLSLFEAFLRVRLANS